MAGIGVGRKSLLPAVSESFEFSVQTQTPTQRRRDGCHGENMVRTDHDAFFLAFTAIAVDDRPDKPRLLFAVRFLSFHYTSSFQCFDANRCRQLVVICITKSDQATGWSSASGSLLPSEYWMA